MCFAETHIGPANVNGTWTLANSPYIVDGNITVVAGEELIIEPGVLVEFSGHFRFTIEGRLVAVGTETDSIHFYAYASANGWSGLRFVDGNANMQDDSEIAFCNIRDGKANGVSPYNRGGGIYLTNTTLSVQNTIITNNEANGLGGGIFCSTGSVLNLQNVIIDNNYTDSDGGGIYCWDAEMYISDSEIQNNHATAAGGGGGIYIGQNSTSTMTRTTIHNNDCYSWGGGIFCETSTIDADKLTIFGNTSYYSGGGINVNSTSTVDFVNSIFWNNSPDQINESTRSITVTYSDVFAPTAPYPGEGNISSDPLFVNPDNEDFHLTINSPCIDSGDPNSTADDDGTTADMGAYYYHHGGTLVPSGYVSGTWDLAGSPYYILGDIEIPLYPEELTLTIDAGVEVRFTGHYQFVINGQLLANGEDGNLITFTIDDTTGFYQYPDLTTGGWHGLRFMGGRGTRLASSLSFCDISYGKAIGSYDESNGGAIYTQYSAEVNISSSNIYNNIATGYGGAICCQYSWSNITLYDNQIYNNEALSGGGVYIEGSDYIYFYDNTIYGNNASTIDGFGGGVYCSNSNYSFFDGDIIHYNSASLGGGFYGTNTQAELSNVSIRNNSASSGGGVYCGSFGNITLDVASITNNNAVDNGGGIYCSDSSPELNHVLIVENDAVLSGGGIYVTGINSNPNFYNVTLSDNSATVDGGGIYVWSASDFTFYNSNIWGNYPDQIYYPQRNGEIYYSNVQGSWTGTGNINVNPNFVDPINDNYHLSIYNLAGDAKNPLIDAGTPYNPNNQYTDYVEEPNPNGSRINMGAYGGTSQAAISIAFYEGGDVNGEEEWESDEMLIIDEDITINPDARLTIQTGTFIEIQDETVGIQVDGSLRAEGTPGNPIKFSTDITGRSRADFWQGFSFTNSLSDTSVFRDVIIENAVTGIDLGNNSFDIINTQILYDQTGRTNSSGSGIVIEDGSESKVDNCDVENYSKGIEVLGSTPTITNSRIRNSPESTREGEIGIDVQGESSVVIDSCEIDHFPTGVKMNNGTTETSTPTMTNSRVRNSPESTRAGEIGIDISGNIEADFDNLDIEDYPYGLKYIPTGGGGRVTPTMTNSRVRNSPQSTREIILITGIQAENTDLDIDNCDINYYQTGIDFSNDGRDKKTLTMTNSRVRNSPESITRDNTDGLKITGDIDALVSNNEFVNCDSALIVLGADAHLDLHHNLIFMKDLTPTDVAIYGENSTSMTIWKNTIYDYDFGLWSVGTTSYLFNNIIWNTGIPIFDAARSDLTVDYNDIFGGYAGTENINADPIFISPVDEDFNLHAISPCVDKGNPDPQYDDPDNTRSDIGRFFYNQDQPTPVELSSFTANIIDDSPTLYWTTASETNNIGWNVYRGDLDNFDVSMQINPELIHGAGTSASPTDYEFADGYEVVAEETYWYWLESRNASGDLHTYGPITLTISSDDPPDELPEQTFLSGNYPNPFRPDLSTTTFRFGIREADKNAALTIYNIKGQVVDKMDFEAGYHNIEWNANKYSSGIYFYKLTSDSYSQVKKMILLK